MVYMITLYLAYADAVNLLGNNFNTIERNAEILLNSCKDIGGKKIIEMVKKQRRT